MTILAMTPTSFMIELHDSLKKKGIAEATADNYIRFLYTINNKKPFKSLGFLRRVEDVKTAIAPYALSSRKSYVASILAVLDHTGMNQKPIYRGVTKKYEELQNELVDTPAPAVSDKQQKNWIPWPDIIAKREELEKIVKELPKTKLTSAQYDTLLQWVILSLYTHFPPRRNKDYQNMYVVKEMSDSLPKDRNYFSEDKFIFNDYKTARKYGQQIEDVPEELVAALHTYLKHHPLNKGKITKTKQIPLLVTADGNPLSAINAITRILNKTLGKKVGSSMLRHIYLTNKYGKTMEEIQEQYGEELAEQKTDAGRMGHTVDTQNKVYIKGGMLEGLMEDD